MSKCRIQSPEFKTRVAMEAISGRKSIQVIAADHAAHPIQVSQWNRQLLGGATEVFTISASGVLTHKFCYCCCTVASGAMHRWFPRSAPRIDCCSGSVVNSYLMPPVSVTRRSATGRRLPWWKNWWN